MVELDIFTDVHLLNSPEDYEVVFGTPCVSLCAGMYGCAPR
jgi:hypothetical protein